MAASASRRCARRRPSPGAARATAVALLAFALGLPALICASANDPSIDGAGGGGAADARAHRFEQAMRIRAKHGVPWREQQEAFDLLVQAAGLRVAPGAAEGGGSSDARTLAALGRMFAAVDGASEALRGAPGMHVACDSVPGAVRELGKIFRDGDGIEPHQGLATALFDHAAALGDPQAQGQMGLRYSLGLQDARSWDKDGVVSFGEPDPNQAMLHYYFAATGGDTLSQMVLGYRHMHGIGVPRSCWSAVVYYQQVAEQVASLATQPRGLPLLERIRLSTASGHGARLDRQREVLQYYQYSADKGNVDAQTAVGQVLNFGTHGVERDHSAALHYLTRAAKSGDVDAMAHLGHMHANGFGTPQDYDAARKWFRLAADEGSASGHFGLGFMHLNGLGVSADADAAFKLITKAANQGSADAAFYLGVMYERGLARRANKERALQYYGMAASANHALAMYNAAMLQLGGHGAARQCKPALALLKQLSERGPDAAALQRGHERFFNSQYSQALVHYLEAAEAGVEVAQANAAWLLHRGYVAPSGSAANATFALLLRSAEQGNVASSVMVADAYLYGNGVEQDWTRAAAVYYDAYLERSPHAMWNLGYVHEFGLGVPKDLSLARRFYAMARHTTRDASVATALATSWLSLHEAWDALARHVPPALAGAWGAALKVEPPHVTPLGAWGDAALRALPMRALMLADAGVAHALAWLRMPQFLADLLSDTGTDGDGVADGASDAGTDTTVLLGLVVALIIVLRARRQRAQGQAAAAEAAQAPPPAAAGAPAAEPDALGGPPRDEALGVTTAGATEEPEEQERGDGHRGEDS